jgi:hypothetical protein
MSVIPLKADIHLRSLHVCLVPKADIWAATPPVELLGLSQMNLEP